MTTLRRSIVIRTKVSALLDRDQIIGLRLEREIATCCNGTDDEDGNEGLELFHDAWLG